MKTLLKISGLGKSYRHNASGIKVVLELLGPARCKSESIDVLRDINFCLKEGESVAVIGRNGAGKSTLLKIIAGTLSPSYGEIEINGKVSAILELGIGFNPELTGRQNAYHMASLMGIGKKVIDSKIEYIKSFAEIGDYFDMPSRTYSSGMQARVSFAVATAFEPEILIVDEALSVGDIYFQHKSFARIKELQKNGTALLIVSHDQHAISSVCSRAILIEDKTILKDGGVLAVADFYNALIAKQEQKSNVVQLETRNGHTQTISGSGEARLDMLALYGLDGNKKSVFTTGESVKLSATASIEVDISQLVFGFTIRDKFGNRIYGTNTMMQNEVQKELKKGDKILFEFCFDLNLGEGGYSISTALVDGNTHIDKNYEWIDFALTFEVVNEKNDFVGCCNLKPKSKVEKI